MPGRLYVVTHPEVDVRPDVPVVEWQLSARGLQRARGMLGLPWVPQVGRVCSSAERKARQTADLLAAHLGLPVLVDPWLGENDRSATGFLPPAEFEALADAFFAAPDRSVCGWETAGSAQRRVVDAVGRCLTGADRETGVAVVAHGAVGTLLWCALADRPVDRSHDQPGQGSWYAVDLDTMQPLSGWRRLPLTG